MRRPQIVLLCALLFCVGTAAAEPAPSDAEFLASLADDTGKTPVATEATCSATSDPCPGFNAAPVSCRCSGPSCSCSSGPDWVECNGERRTCLDPIPCSAIAQCPGGSSVFCSGTNYSCSVLPCAVRCDGVTTLCPGFSPFTCPLN